MKSFNLSYVLLLMAFMVSSCNTYEATTDEVPPCHKITQSIQPAADWQPGDMSLYNLSSTWINHRNDSVKLDHLQGKLQLVALMYTSCTYACPRILHDLKMIDEQLNDEEKKYVDIVLVTLDPERDTPDNLKSFSEKFKLDDKRWTLLTSSESNIRELSGLLNVQYKKETTLDISHSNIISLLDANGELLFQKEGLGTDPDEMIKEIKRALSLNLD